MKNIHWKYQIFTKRAVFALISTIFVHRSCNFTRSSPIHVKIFHILLINLWKCLEKIQFLHWTESNNFLRKNKDSLRRVKYIFSKHFRMLVNKIWKNSTYIVLLCVKLQLQWTKIVEMRSKTVRGVNIWNF